MKLVILFVLALMQFVLSVVQAADTSPEPDQKAILAYSQAAIGKVVGDYVFTNTYGQQVQLASFQGRPLVISLIYTSCYHICPTVTRHLSDVVDKARQALGDKSFNVLTIGFDTTNDTVDAMRVFAAQQSVNSDNWQFLSADEKTISGLAKDLGFQFRVSPKGFDHLIQASVVDGQGKVYRQVYDMDFSTPLLVEPLKQLLDGQPRKGSLIGHIGDKIRLFCTVYDPANDRYFVDYSIIMGSLIGLTCMGFVFYVLMREWRRYRQQEA